MRGLIGYVATVQARALQPIYRMSLAGDYLEANSTSESDAAGCNLEGILGYAP